MKRLNVSGFKMELIKAYGTLLIALNFEKYRNILRNLLCQWNLKIFFNN
jgi:hypothetical protein